MIKKFSINHENCPSFIPYIETTDEKEFIKIFEKYKYVGVLKFTGRVRKHIDTNTYEFETIIKVMYKRFHKRKIKTFRTWFDEEIVKNSSWKEFIKHDYKYINKNMEEIWKELYYKDEKK